MKVILLRDVPNVGRKYDIKEVSDGFGRNFLLRSKLAEPATERSLKMAEAEKQKIAAAKNAAEAEIEAGLAKLAKISVSMKGKANEDGHLFAGIKAEDLSQAIKDQHGLNLPAEYIKLDKPVKTIGEHAVEAAVGGKKASLKLIVERE